MDYTPTTEEVRRGYVSLSKLNLQDPYHAIVSEWFDRWLAEVKAQIWDEAYTEGYRHGTCDVEPSDNPYRGENK